MSGAAAPAVTVAICLYDSRRHLAATLESVFAQTFSDYELVLVDDGSTDGTLELAATLCRGRRVRLIPQPHRGLSHARRACIDAASGPLIAFLDHDDRWAPGKLERQIAAARAHPEAALFFTDCAYVDDAGRHQGLVSEHYGLGGVDLSGANAYRELLRRGCFVWQSTVMARTAAIRAVDPFDPVYPYIADYDTWLRMTRLWPAHYTPEVLASWRVHDTQFTNRAPATTLADHRALLGGLMKVASIPAGIRNEIGDRLLGQHRESARRLWRQGRRWAAVVAVAQMVSYPRRLYAFLRGALAETPAVGPAVRSVYRWLTRRASTAMAPAAAAPRELRVWVDGSVLAAEQTGMFTHTRELIRTLAAQPGVTVHVRLPATSPSLRQLFGGLADRLRVQRLGRPKPHSDDRTWAERLAAVGRPVAAASFRRAGRSSSEQAVTELLFWRGRYQWRDSRHVAVVADLTTAILPELHTAENVREHTAFVRYVERHAHLVLTPSERTRRDVLRHTRIQPERVTVVPPAVHPAFLDAAPDSVAPALYGIVTPYVLFVGAVEPRKNLRRLLPAFVQATSPQHGTCRLVIVGPDGWDQDFASFVSQTPGGQRVHRTGFVPVEHLPSLYHHASVVVCPSVYEGFGLPVLEAMCCRAIVAAAAGGAQEETLGGTGIVFDPYDVDAMAGAIRRAIELPGETASAQRLAARTRAEVVLARGEASLREALLGPL